MNETSDTTTKTWLTLLFPVELRRLQFIVRWLIWIVAILCSALVAEFVPSLQPGLFLIVALLGVVYAVLGLYLPRIKNAGISPWFLLLLLVPLANFVVLLILLVAPPKQ